VSGYEANIKGANKDANIFVGRSTTVAQSFVLRSYIMPDEVTNLTFVLVNSSVRSKQLCFVHSQGLQRMQYIKKIATYYSSEAHQHNFFLLTN